MKGGEDFSKLVSIVILALAIGSFVLFNSIFLTSILIIFAILSFLGFIPTYGQVHENESIVIFRFGKYFVTHNPGVFWYYPRFDELVSVDMRMQVFDVPPYDYITQDDIVAKVDCVYYIKVKDPRNALTKVKDYKTAITSIISSNLRNIIAGLTFDQLNSGVDEINNKIKKIIEETANEWGLEVYKVEIQKIIPPETLIDALKKKKEAEEKKLTLEIQARARNVNLQVLDEVVSKMNEKTLSFLYLETLKSMAEGRANKIYFPAELTYLADKVAGIVKPKEENK